MARTPSKEAHDKVLTGALKLVAERGIESTSMDAIAAESGVSKATVYRHWAGKEALLLDVIRNFSERLPEFESVNAKDDMVAFLVYLAQGRKHEQLSRIWPKVIGYAAANPEFARGMQNYVFEPRRAQIARIIARAAAAGELRAGIDSEFATDVLVGPLMHRRFSGHTVRPELARQIVDYFWEVFRQRTMS